MVKIEKQEGTKKLAYTMELVEDDGGRLACPIREIAVASNPTGRAGIIADPKCTNNCVLWSNCVFNGGIKAVKR